MNGNKEKVRPTEITLTVGNPGWDPSNFTTLNKEEQNRVITNLSYDGCSDPPHDCNCDCRIDCKKD